LYNNLGEMAGRQGHYTLAENYLKESLVIHRDLGDMPGIALCLANLAQVALRQKNTEKFVWLYGAIERLRVSIGANMQDDEKEGFEQNVTAARRQLGLARFEQLWGTGQSLSLEQVIAQALEGV
jgi:hypothetical protein